MLIGFQHRFNGFVAVLYLISGHNMASAQIRHFYNTPTTISSTTTRQPLQQQQQTYAASASAASIVFNRCSNVDDVLGSVLWDGLENWRAVTPGRNFNELSLISFEMAPLLFAFASATLGS